MTLGMRWIWSWRYLSLYLVPWQYLSLYLEVLVLVPRVEVLGVPLVVDGVGGDRVVQVGAVQVVAAVRVTGVPLQQLLAWKTKNSNSKTQKPFTNGGPHCFCIYGKNDELTRIADDEDSDYSRY